MSTHYRPEPGMSWLRAMSFSSGETLQVSSNPNRGPAISTVDRTLLVPATLCRVFITAFGTIQAGKSLLSSFGACWTNVPLIQTDSLTGAVSRFVFDWDFRLVDQSLVLLPQGETGLSGSVTVAGEALVSGSSSSSIIAAETINHLVLGP